MESIVSDTTMIQTKSDENGSVRKIDEFPLEKNIPQ